MSAATDYDRADVHDRELAPYRAVCRSAVVSLALAALSVPLVVMALYSAAFQYGDAVPLGYIGAFFATIAIALAIAGLGTLRRYPTEYTGWGLARTGLVGGLLMLVIGVSVSSYTYATEVPDGYERVAFGELQPDPEHPELPMSPKAIELQGKPIFIKGYMHPGVASMGKVDHFILVSDLGTCCFGGQPKPTHMIEVATDDASKKIAYSTRRLKIAGTFIITQEPTESLGLNGVWFHLKLDQVK